MTNYATHVSTKKTSQQEKVFGREDQAQNSAGGYVFTVDQWTRLERFLILGAEGGTYYASERKLTRENAQCVLTCAESDFKRTVDTIAQISDSGRAPKNNAAIFALALVAKLAKAPEARRYAFDQMATVCRIGTHVFQFAEAVKHLGGWGRATHRAFTEWYMRQDTGNLAYQAIKYQSREGWTHRDILRKVKPVPGDDARNALFKWIAKGELAARQPADTDVMSRVWAFEQAKKLTTKADLKQLIDLIFKYNLPHECVPTEAKNFPDLWEVLLPRMPATAMLRNLGVMTAKGLLTSMSNSTTIAIEKLRGFATAEKVRLHPFQVLLALKTYAAGQGVRGSLEWKPVQKIVDQLDTLFYARFGSVEKTGKRYFLGLDISGSMGSLIQGTHLSAREGVGALAMLTYAREDQVHVTGFCSSGGWRAGGGYASPEMGKIFTMGGDARGWGRGIADLDISNKKRLDTISNYMASLPMGGTDCALPMLYAANQKIPADVFVVYTDNETWAGDIQPFQALQEYRQVMGIPAKLIVVGMTATDFSIADPTDAGMMDVVGFDAAAPNLMADFVKTVI